MREDTFNMPGKPILEICTDFPGMIVRTGIVAMGASFSCRDHDGDGDDGDGDASRGLQLLAVVHFR